MANQADLDSIVERIQKLQQLTTENGATEGEVAAAAGRIAALLDKHNLSLDDSVFNQQAASSPQGAWSSMFIGTRSFHQCCRCVDAVAGFFDCRGWTLLMSWGRACYFIGFPEDVQAALALLTIIRKAMDEGWAAFRKRWDIYGKSETERYSYMAGFALRVSERLDELKALRTATQVSANGTALVPFKAAHVDEWVKQSGLADIPTTERKGREEINHYALHAGARDGERVELQKGLPNARS